MSEAEYVDEAQLLRLRRLGGRSLLTRMIDIFLENAPKRIEAARVGGESGDLEAVKEAMHSLKSSAGNLGAVGLQELARNIERQVAEEKGEEIPALVSDLEEYFAPVKVRLEEEKKGLEE